MDFWIGARRDGEMVWEPIKVQIEVKKMAKIPWRQKEFHKYPAQMVSQLFKWSFDGVILLDVTIQGAPGKGGLRPWLRGDRLVTILGISPPAPPGT